VLGGALTMKNGKCGGKRKGGKKGY